MFVSAIFRQFGICFGLVAIGTGFLLFVYICVVIAIRARCTTLCDKVCQLLATDRWFSLGTVVSSTNKTYLYDISEILLNTIKM
jgi:hypothetical protein